MKSTLVDNLAPHRLVGGISAILLLVVCTAAAWAWGPDTSAQPDAERVDLNYQARRDVGNDAGKRCEECGVVESTQVIEHDDEKPGEKGELSEMAATPGKTAEVSVTVHMDDGSSRLFTDTSPVHWRLGERVIIIGGYAPGAD